MKPINSVLNAMWDRLHPKSPTLEYSTSITQAQARIAIENAQDDLQTALGNKQSVSVKVMALRQQRGRNHFAELIEATMRGNG